jgi:hypothetical protein
VWLFFVHKRPAGEKGWHPGSGAEEAIETEGQNDQDTKKSAIFSSKL